MKVDINFTPPRFVALVWRDRGNGTWIDLDIDRNPGFWRWWYLGQRKLPRVGVFVTKIEDDWCAMFDPRADFEIADLERVIAEIGAEVAELPRILFDGDVPESAAQAAQARGDRQAIVDCKRSVESGIRIQADAQALLREWGDFCSDVHRLREIVAMPPNMLLSTYAYNEIRAAKRKTEKRAQKRLAEAQVLPTETSLTWSDDEVMRSVRFLTSNDSDHASVANDRGWSSSDSAAGHWCAKMMRDPQNSSVALNAARQIVGKYARQLVSAGIVPRERFQMPVKRRKAA